MKSAIFAFLAFLAMFLVALFVVGTIDLMSLRAVDRFVIAICCLYSAVMTWLHMELSK